MGTCLPGGRHGDPLRHITRIKYLENLHRVSSALTRSIQVLYSHFEGILSHVHNAAWGPGT